MRSVTLALLVVGLLFPFAQTHTAETFPSRPVQIILPFAAGGSLSTLGMALGKELGTKWPYQPVIEARPGAGGNIGAEYVARSAPDGYTLLFGTQSLAANATLMPSPNFDPDKSWDEKKEMYRMSDKIVRTANVTQSAVGDKNGRWTTTIAAAILIFDDN